MKYRSPRRCPRPDSTKGWLSAFLLLLLMGCGAPEGAPSARTEEPVEIGSRVQAIGDIDPDTPAHRIRMIQPLADRLAAGLADQEVGAGRVVIARDIPEMAQMMREGKVDLYIDSIFPAVSVRRLAAAKLILRGSIRGAWDYSGILVAPASVELRELSELVGEVVAFEEPHSTSGYVLPFAALSDLGLEMVQLHQLSDPVPAGTVGYYFSGDEENSMALALEGEVSAAAISTNDWEELPEAHRERLRIIGRTMAVPRQVVSLRPDLDPDLISRLQEVLLELDGSPLGDSPDAWSWEFRALSPECLETLDKVEALAGLLPDARVDPSPP